MVQKYKLFTSSMLVTTRWWYLKIIDTDYTNIFRTNEKRYHTTWYILHVISQCYPSEQNRGKNNQ